MIILIDNYDSFTYNLVHMLEQLGQQIEVYPHDGIDIPLIREKNPTHIILSPGPKDPEHAGICLPLIQALYRDYPILGVCLGHQCIAHAFGARIHQAPLIMHGKTSLIEHHGRKLFQGVPSPFQAMRYHSLIVDITTLPESLAIDAWADDTIMAISHREYPLFGVQFHPESILTEWGMVLLQNFCNIRNSCLVRLVVPRLSE
ncbi:MAG: aminodeoxychorismate/anthranilate synthase component II [Legionellaceae bacterium]|nr:aminodeoxychorismate/anthranilate synthase component II [Legionellaceae bacterium]